MTAPRCIVKHVRLLVRGDVLLGFSLDRQDAEDIGRAALALHDDGDSALYWVRHVTHAEDMVSVEILSADRRPRYLVHYDAHGYAAVLDRKRIR